MLFHNTNDVIDVPFLRKIGEMSIMQIHSWFNVIFKGAFCPEPSINSIEKQLTWLQREYKNSYMMRD